MYRTTLKRTVALCGRLPKSERFPPTLPEARTPCPQGEFAAVHTVHYGLSALKDGRTLFLQ
jgi:hypothetical protein